MVVRHASADRAAASSQPPILPRSAGMKQQNNVQAKTTPYNNH